MRPPAPSLPGRPARLLPAAEPSAGAHRIGQLARHLRPTSAGAPAPPPPAAAPAAASGAAAAAPGGWSWAGAGGSLQNLQLAGRPAFVITPSPHRRANGPIPWLWYAPALQASALPDIAANDAPKPDGANVWMFERFLAAGIGVAGIDAGESYGSPSGVEIFDALYDELTQQAGDIDHVQRFSYKPVLLGQSRGGLQTLGWAARRPRCVGGWAGIYPVCDVASYPGLDKACDAYGVSEAELQRDLAEHNPLKAAPALAQAGVPLFAIHVRDAPTRHHARSYPSADRLGNRATRTSWCPSAPTRRRSARGTTVRLMMARRWS